VIASFPALRWFLKHEDYLTRIGPHLPEGGLGKPAGEWFPFELPAKLFVLSSNPLDFSPPFHEPRQRSHNGHHAGAEYDGGNAGDSPASGPPVPDFVCHESPASRFSISPAKTTY